MVTPRSKLVDSTVPLFYHLVSRCVRRSWLCGEDRQSGQDFSHRKGWLVDRMTHLARCFAVEIAAWAIMDNHFHLIVYYDPKVHRLWTDEEVARRWVDAFPPKIDGQVDEGLKALAVEQLLDDPDRLEDRRRKLGCLSTFMKHLKQPIAFRANQEDGCQGHFFESRFYSGALLTEEAVIASMAYVDLNPVRAKIALSLEYCRNTSIEVRLQQLENTAERLLEAISCLVSGIGDAVRRIPITLGDYIEVLREFIRAELLDFDPKESSKPSPWLARVRAFGKRQRAYGSAEALNRWVESRGWKQPGACLPE